MKKIINSEKAPRAIGPYSQAVEANGILFISGQLPIDPLTGKIAEGIKAQAIQVFKNIEAILTAAGYSFDDVVKSTVLLSDISNFAVLNEVYAQYYTGNYPARAAYQVAALPLGALVEIETIAVK